MKPPPWWTRWRRDLRAVDRPPGPEWRDRAVHHGFRLLFVALGSLAVTLLFPRAPVPDFALLEEGMVAREDVIAEIGFEVEKSEERLEEERREAERSVSPIFRLRPSVADTVLRRTDAFFGGLDSVLAGEAAGAEAAPDTARLRRWLTDRGLSASPGQLRYLSRERNRHLLEEELKTAFRTLLPGGVVPASDLEGTGARRVVVRGPKQDRLVAVDSLMTTGEFYEQAGSLPLSDSAAAAVQLYQTLVVQLAEPTLQLDRTATRLARQQARRAVEETQGYVLEGERIVTAHERVTGSDVQELQAYREALLAREGVAGGVRLLQGAGGFLYAFLLLSLLGLVLLFYRRDVYVDAAGFLIVLGSVVLVLGAASAVARAEASSMLIPVAFASLVVAALYDGLLGVVTAAVVTALVAGQPPFTGVTAPFGALAAGSAGAMAMPWLRRRAQSWTLIAAIAGGYLLAGCALALLHYFSLADLLEAVGWGSLNAAVSTVFAVGAVVPALEKVTGITTDQTLLELSDLNRPLLRRLSREAPGTYAHSINVANLAEAACSAVGANAVLARVGVYYHDIGKIVQPQFFVENQPQGRNPHDRLRPSRSAEVIRGHVKEGLRLAEEAGLPEAVRDFIREHHGTRKISFFLEKAKEEEPELNLDPGEFAYPGPKPQSKETAVVMLADGIESAVRALQNPAPDRVRSVIEQIVRERIEERQLDQCPLTLEDLDRIEDQFSRVLTGMYHQRIDYPEQASGAAQAARSARPG